MKIGSGSVLRAKSMLSSLSSVRLFSFTLLLGLALFAAPASLAQQDDSVEDDFKAGPVPGQQTFTSTCAGCHGLDGQGSEKAPNIVGSAKVQHLSDAQISGIISNGVSGTGMPGFRSLSPAQVRDLVGYLRVLQGKSDARVPPGDAERGKKVFFGKGECSSCHTISGEGGFLGPDLSAYGAAMSAQVILKALVNPVGNIPPGYRLAAATTRDGNRIEGLVRNEDNFSLQMQTKGGDFFFFQKSDLQSLEYLNRSLMPANYGERLNRDELDDLVSYILKTGSSSKTDAASQGR